jgi:hypothetical protein
MVRTLLVVFFVGMMVSIGGLIGTSMLGGFDSKDLFHGTFSHETSEGDKPALPWPAEPGVVATRQIEWSGAEALDINIPAEVTYTQSDQAGITITGPKNWIERIVVDGDAITTQSGAKAKWTHKDSKTAVLIEVRAPNVKAFEINGAGKLAINGYQQDRLKVDVNGAGEVTAQGEAARLEVQVNGAGEGDFGKLTVQEADIELNGAGAVTAGPTQHAELEINGVGAIRLLNRPPELKQTVHGIGTVQVEDPARPIVFPKDGSRAKAL